MSDLDALLHDFGSAKDQSDAHNEAQMATLARQWAAFYCALVAGGIPQRTAQRMTERQQGVMCSLLLDNLNRERS